MDILGSLWNIIVLFFWAFIFIAALIAFIMVIGDLFRDKNLNGWAKAVWILFLVFIPLLTSLVYMVVRGGGIPGRINDAARQDRDAAEEYIREVAGSSPADEISKAKTLLDAGTITAEEFSALKATALLGTAGTR